MSITRLQQARQMFRYGGDTMGGPNDKSNNGGSGNGAVDTGDLGTEAANVAANVSANMDARDRARSEMYTNMPTPTITVGVDKFNNPITVKTTYRDKRNRELALDALNKKGISAFDPRITKNFNLLDMSFVPQPTQNNPFSLKNIAKNVVLGIVAPQLLGKNFATGMKAFNTVKTLSQLAQDINLTDKNVLDSFISNLTSKTPTLSFDKTKTKTTKNEDDNKDRRGDGGINTLENIDALNKEYLLLLNKFMTGVFTDSDQVRFTFLQKILGK